MVTRDSAQAHSLGQETFTVPVGKNRTESDVVAESLEHFRICRIVEEEEKSLWKKGWGQIYLQRKNGKGTRWSQPHTHAHTHMYVYMYIIFI